MSVKKESLFKQKLKQAKVMQDEKQSKKEDNHQIQSFPKVFKIEQYDIGKHIEANKSLVGEKSEPMVDQAEQQYKKQQEEQSYLTSHQSKLTGILSEDQLNQINSQNWNAVNSMTPEERENYINLIQNTLPQHFIKKLKKNKPQPSTSLLNQTPNIQKMIPEIQKISLNPSLNPIPTLQTSSDKENQINDESDDHKVIMDQIYLNIKTEKLVYLPENVLVTFSEDQKSQLLNKTKIFEMLTAENNQSQIVGSQLTLMWLKNIFPSSNLVFYVDNIPFHIRIMVSQMYGLLKIIQLNLKSTKFYSCYIEMLVKSVEILTIVYKNLSLSQLKQQVLVIQNEFMKTQKSLKELLNSKKNVQNQQNNQRQQKQMLFQSLGILYQSLKQQQSSKEEIQKMASSQIEIEQQFEKLQSNNKLNELVEVILIEQTMRKQQFQKYEIYPSINNFLQTVSQFWNCKIGPYLSNLTKILTSMKKFYNVFYQLVCKFSKKQKSLPFYRNLIKNIYRGILQVIQEPYLKKIFEWLSYNEKVQGMGSKDKKIQNEVSNQIFFQILFIYRQLSCDSGKFPCFLENQKEKYFITEDQTSILVYLNFDHYVSVSDLKNDEIKTLENMLYWLKNQMQNNGDQSKRIFLDSDEVLTTLMKLFLSSEQEVYSLLDQNLLHEVFKEAITFYESKKDKMFPILSENEINKMVQNYNFNSFGNDIFTKVIFWVAVSINPQTESLIGQQVMMRYPMLFYYACEPIKAIENLKSQQHQQKEKKQNPLLGDLSHYINTKLGSQKCGFSVQSNQFTKENLLKLLSLNLDFGLSDFLKQQKIRIILSSQQKGQTQGFNISKQKVNNQNYFIRYLIQPFIKK